MNKDLYVYPDETCDAGDVPGVTETRHFHQDFVAGYTIPGYTIHHPAVHHPLVHHDAYHADAYEYWYICGVIEGVNQWCHYTVPAVDYGAWDEGNYDDPPYDDPAWVEHVPAVHHYHPYEDYDYTVPVVLSR